MRRCEEHTWEREPDARGARPADRLWAKPGAFWSQPRNPTRTGSELARTQRHGQDHHGALDHGHRSTEARNDFLSKRVTCGPAVVPYRPGRDRPGPRRPPGDRKSTRLNSSHVEISYAVFCLKKKKKKKNKIWKENNKMNKKNQRQSLK